MLLVHVVDPFDFFDATMADHDDVANLVPWQKCPQQDNVARHKRGRHAFADYSAHFYHKLGLFGFPKNLGDGVDLVKQLLAFFGLVVVFALAGLLGCLPKHIVEIGVLFQMLRLEVVSP